MAEHPTAPSPTVRPGVILDCDPGHDDVAAIALAAGVTELVAVTTVAGNAPLHRCTHNALATLELLGADIPVFAGADRPLVRPPRHAPEVHGESGLGGVDVPEPSRKPEDTTAVEALIDLTRRRPGMWLVPTGPLTNIALAIRADPSLPDRIAGISLMGGSLGTGNVTPAAEFNFWADPDAASIVFDACRSAGTELRMCGLDVTNRFLVGADHATRLAAVGSPIAQFLGQVFTAYAASCELLTGVAAGALHDPCAVAALVAPDVFGWRHLSVDVDRTGLTAGMSVADRRVYERGGATAPNAWVALDIDADAVFGLLTDGIAAAGGTSGNLT